MHWFLLNKVTGHPKKEQYQKSFSRSVVKMPRIPFLYNIPGGLFLKRAA